MSRIRGKNTSPELAVRRLLHRMGYRFRLHVRIPVTLEGRVTTSPTFKISSSKSAPSPPRVLRGSVVNPRLRYIRPDIVLPKYKTAIFVHGCFWHRHRGCKNCTTPTNRREWWVAKLEGNAARDKVHQRTLKKLGWRVLVVWECDAENITSLEAKATRLLTKR